MPDNVIGSAWVEIVGRPEAGFAGKLERSLKVETDKAERGAARAGERFGTVFGRGVALGVRGINTTLDGVLRTAGRVGAQALHTVGFAAVGAGVAVGAMFVQGARDAAAYQTLQLKTAAVIASTGNIAGLSVKGVDSLAASLESLSGVDETLIIQSENVLATFTRIRNQQGAGNDIFDQATKAALNLSVAMGGDLQGATLQVGKALSDPVAGLTALSRVGVRFTEQQRQQITALVGSGNALGAQKVILAELTTEFGGMAEAAGKGFQGSMARAKDAVTDLMREIATPFLDDFAVAASYVADVVEHTVGPAIKGFIADFQTGTGVAGDIRDVLREVWDVAANKVYPAITDLVQGFQDGTGAGGDIRDLLADVRDVGEAAGRVIGDVIVPAAKDIAAVLVPAIHGLADVLKPLFDFIADHDELFTDIVIGAVGLAAAFKVMSTYTKLKELLIGISVGEAAVGDAALVAEGRVGGLAGKLSKLGNILKVIGFGPAAIVTLAGLSSLHEAHKANEKNDALAQQVKDLKALGDAQKSASAAAALGVTPIGGLGSSQYLSDSKRSANETSAGVQLLNDAMRFQAGTAKQVAAALDSGDPKRDLKFQKARAAAAAGVKGVADAANKALDTNLQLALAGAAEKAAKAAAAAATKTLQAARDVIDKQLDHIKDRIREIADFRTSVVNDALGQADITKLRGEAGAPTTVAGIQTLLQQQLHETFAFNRNLASLSHAGLSSDLLKQLSAAGSDQGGALATALAHASGGQIAEINRLTAHDRNLATALGQTATTVVFGPETEKRLTAQQRSLEAALARNQRALDRIAGTLDRAPAQTGAATAAALNGTAGRSQARGKAASGSTAVRTP